MRISSVLRTALAGAALSAPAAAQWVEGPSTLTTGDLVGVGTDTPLTRLHVSESVFSPAFISENHKYQGTGIRGESSGSNGYGVVGTAASGSGVGLKGNAGGTSGRGVWGYASSSSGTNYGVYGQVTSSSGFSGYFTGGKFQIQGDFTGINRGWKINSTERFGIYSFDPNWSGMYVAANGGAKPYYGYANNTTASAYHYYNPSDSSWRLYIKGNRLAVKSNGRVGIATTNPGYTLHVNGSAGKPGGGSWSNASDLRLKKNVAPIEGGLERLLAIRGVSYEYKEPAAIHELPGKQLGVIAQEVEEVFPDWVDEGSDGFKRVTFRGFEGVAVEALRELATANSALRGTVADQALELDELRARLAAIEAALELR